MEKNLEAHNRATNQLIEVANTLKQKHAQDPTVVSAGLMAACGLYCLFLNVEQEDKYNENQKSEMIKGLRENLKTSHEDLAHCANQFMHKASKLHEEMHGRQVYAALMAASAIFATFVTAGNQGFLRPEGVKKVSEKYGQLLTVVTAGLLSESQHAHAIVVYRENLDRLQALKEKQLAEQGHDTQSSPPQTGEA